VAAVSVRVRDAATVLLVRDPPGREGRVRASGADQAGLEVFLVRRTLDAAFIGGAYVFPGGAVDPGDREVGLEEVCEGRTDAQASVLLDLESGGLAFWVAAVRECFEEAGVLLAYRRPGELVSMDDPAVAARFARYRGDLDAGRLRLVDVCRQEGLRLAVDRLHYWARWITPEGPPRRFDTRFFVARAPAGQVPLHDDRETIDNLWASPAGALAQHRAGGLDLIVPTIKNLEAISQRSCVADLLEAAAAREEVPAIQPRVVADGDGIRVVLPGDPDYERAASEEPLPPGSPLPGRPGGPGWSSRSVPGLTPDVEDEASGAGGGEDAPGG
jgi:8-oxo-dGTP pyrophosphatase MutT (NUDIX family)